MERGWRIDAWSRERGRGRIVSDAGILEFDAAVALVDDFAAGELVDIVLEGGVVKRIEPRVARSPVAHVAPQPAASWTAALDAINARFDSLTAVVVTAATESTLVVELRHTEWPRMPARCAVTFEDVAYVQLPMHATWFERISARVWADVIAARPSWLAAFSIELDDVDPDAVLVVFEPGDHGRPSGFVIARSIRTA